MNDRIAVDIILLPPEDVMDLAIEINQTLESDHKTPLDKTNYIPHISLLMGAVEASRLEELKAVIAHIAQNLEPIQLTAHFENKPFSMFMIDQNPALSKLHEQVLDETVDIVTPDITPASLFDDDIDKDFIDYMRNFRKNSSRENFDPHITIGRGMNLGYAKTITFSANKLAIGHLGDRCNVRQILYTP